MDKNVDGRRTYTAVAWLAFGWTSTGGNRCRTFLTSTGGSRCRTFLTSTGGSRCHTFLTSTGGGCRCRTFLAFKVFESSGKDVGDFILTKMWFQFHFPPHSESKEVFVHDMNASLWSKTAKNTDCSTGPLARPFACSLAPLTRGKVNYYMPILSVFFFHFQP